MSLQLAAKHLASKGRGPDTQLVHMSLGEVKSLQDLAKAHGGSLSINPDTGLPEAGFLDSLLPAIVGAGLMFATGGAAGAAIIPGLSNAATIGLGIGGLQTLRTGDLGKGIMAGLGAYGGAGLTAGLAGPGMTVTNPQAAQIAAQHTGAATAAEQAAIQNAIAAQAAPGAGGIQSITFGDAASFPQIPQSAFDVGSHIEDVNMLGAGTMPPTLAPPESGIAMGDMGITEADMRNYRSQLQPSTFAERFKAMPGKDLAKYGLAAAAPSLLAGPEYKPPELDREQMRFTYNPGRREDPRAGYPEDYRGEYAYFEPSFTRMAEGGVAEGYRYEYDPLNQGFKRTSAPAESGISSLGRFASLIGNAQGADDLAQYKYAYDPATQRYTNVAPPPAPPAEVVAVEQGYGGDSGGGGYGGDPGDGGGGGGYSGGDVGGGGGSHGLGGADSVGGWAAGGLSALAHGGQSHLGDYSDGGRLLRGPGDGVSDSIPAVIGQKRPARLADGEFVVPARIVSELGNGSTEAGARKLYAMMDRVQRARGKTTGKGKVAKNTRADKYLPA